MVIKFILFLSILFPSLAWATSPGEISTTYDAFTKILHVEAPHPSDKLDKHYIRTMKIFVNGAEPIIYSFTRQNKPSKFETDVSLDLVDVSDLKIQLWCSQGGTKELVTQITVPPVEKQEK